MTRGWRRRVATVAVLIGLATPTVLLKPIDACAACAAFSSPEVIAKALRQSPYTVVFEGVVRQRWFSTSLIEVERVWQGRVPSRLVTAGPRGGPEGGINDLVPGRSYLFAVGTDGPMYTMGCAAPFDADPKVIELLGPAAGPPAFGPFDFLVVIGFILRAAWVLLLAAAVCAWIAISILRSGGIGGMKGSLVDPGHHVDH